MSALDKRGGIEEMVASSNKPIHEVDSTMSRNSK